MTNTSIFCNLVLKCFVAIQKYMYIIDSRGRILIVDNFVSSILNFNRLFDIFF